MQDDLSRRLDPQALSQMTPAAVALMVSELCRINVANLESTLERHPGLFAYASAQHELAKVAEARAEWMLERKRAEAFKRTKDAHATMPANRIEREVETDQEVVSAAEHYFTQKAITARLKALVNGLEHRRDMLVQLSARQRKEWQH
jgi:hypothetical protein